MITCQTQNLESNCKKKKQGALSALHIVPIAADSCAWSQIYTPSFHNFALERCASNAAAVIAWQSQFQQVKYNMCLRVRWSKKENKSKQGHNGTIMGLKSISCGQPSALLKPPKIHSVHLALNGMLNGAALAVGVAASYICGTDGANAFFKTWPPSNGRDDSVCHCGRRSLFQDANYSRVLHYFWRGRDVADIQAVLYTQHRNRSCWTNAFWT